MHESNLFLQHFIDCNSDKFQIRRFLFVSMSISSKISLTESMSRQSRLPIESLADDNDSVVLPAPVRLVDNLEVGNWDLAMNGTLQIAPWDGHDDPRILVFLSFVVLS